MPEIPPVPPLDGGALALAVFSACCTLFGAALLVWIGAVQVRRHLAGRFVSRRSRRFAVGVCRRVTAECDARWATTTAKTETER